MNIYVLDHQGTRVIVNEDKPSRSTAYFPERGAGAKPDDPEGLSPLYRVPLGRRVSGWKQDLERLVAESQEPEADQMWGAHDYFAALHLRSSIDNLQPGESLSEEELDILRDGDQLCWEFTESDVQGLVMHYGNPAFVSLDWWWWRRLPTSGAARGELMSWSQEPVGSKVLDVFNLPEVPPRSENQE